MSAWDRYDFCNNNCALLPPYAAILRLSLSLTLNSVDSLYPTIVNKMGEFLNLWSGLNSVHYTYERILGWTSDNQDKDFMPIQAPVMYLLWLIFAYR